MLNICLLGGIAFSVDGTIVKAELGLAGRLLSCYLFEFAGRAHRRERLADLFWGEMEPDRARSALNTAIWRLRRMLDRAAVGGSRHLVTIGDDILLEPVPFIEVDTHAVENASKRAIGGQDPRSLTDSDEREIGAALERYQGPFLDGNDGDWVLQERERLHSLYIRSTRELMRVAARRQQYARALAYGRKVLSIDPFRESVQRDVMLLLLLDGQRAEAIRSYQNLRTLLRSDLGIEPMPDTKRLSQMIQSGEIFDSLDEYRSVYFGPQEAARMAAGPACP